MASAVLLKQGSTAVITCIEEQIQKEGRRSLLESGAEMEDWTPGSQPVAVDGI